ncbi:fumarylacetoacetate hydrolase domain-containing protein 2A [Paraglaciecola mesophila KMM 241]|uniref:Fumarylacetoacetate hydrolase domain-containing protein 2A n=1 Tax=Paraglaciecola mesophila KMM 241 TaxID=1128912 RepID=K6Z4Y6_9ALTE|nr:fumarylacetoacetate hydrolase family protein [Paraglaciecola mesophila]GAC24068.1 fumarylacetoacetate hydrolase domain-containing protein 2A [Paraglaciecola mesophila KMM 241]
MKILQYKENEQIKLAVKRRDGVIPLALLDAGFPGDMKTLIEKGMAVLNELSKKMSAYNGPTIPLDSIEFALPVNNPERFLCLGLNYVDHAKEGNNSLPEHPAIFMRTPTSLAAHNQSLLLPKVNNKLDYEAELLVVIGKQAKYLTVDNALDAVWGYSLFNDGSVRPYQRWSTQWTMGKNFDQTGGFGPWIVTPDELPLGAKGLNIEMRLNDQVMQQANTDDMVFDVVNTLVQISECMTLQPGDCIAMGTPSGVGYPRNPPVFLQPGDIAEVEVQGVGILRNGIVLEE